MSQIIKISYPNWLSSAQKWVEIVKRVKAKESFVCDYGFQGLLVATYCGYCLNVKKHFASNMCRGCALYHKKTNGTPICFEGTYEVSYLFLFLREMKEYPINLEDAQRYAEIILQAILEDCPNKDRAIQDGIIFPTKETITS